MRRASELEQITAIHQIGIRSFGSAAQDEWDKAMRWGAQIHLARDIFRHGMGPVIDALPTFGKFFVTLDVDGLDHQSCQEQSHLHRGDCFGGILLNCLKAGCQRCYYWN